MRAGRRADGLAPPQGRCALAAHVQRHPWTVLKVNTVGNTLDVVKTPRLAQGASVCFAYPRRHRRRLRRAPPSRRALEPHGMRCLAICRSQERIGPAGIGARRRGRRGFHQSKRCTRRRGRTSTDAQFFPDIGHDMMFNPWRGSGGADGAVARPPRPIAVPGARRRCRARTASCFATSIRAVPPPASREFTGPVDGEYLAAVRRSGWGWMSASSPSSRSSYASSLASAARTAAPAASWATENGTPLRTSHSATSVARV